MAGKPFNCSSLSSATVTNASDSLSDAPNKTRSSCFLYAELVGYFYVQATICIVGFFLNVLNCIIFCRKKQFEGAAYRFMAVLSVVDAVTLLTLLPQSFMRCEPYLSICTHPSFKIFRNYLVRFEVYAGYSIHNATEAISAWLTCFLSVERYLAIKYHYIVKAYFSPPNVHKMLAAIFAVGALVNLPMFFVHKIVYPPRCNASMPLKQRVMATSMTKHTIYSIYTWARTFLVQFGPLLFLCVVNSLLIHIVRKQSQKRSLNKGNTANANTPATLSANARNEKRARAQRKLTILLMVIIGLFLGGQIPQAFAYRAIFNVLYPAPCPKCCNSVYDIFRMLAQNVCLFSYGANFFVYVGLNRHFRKALVDMCCLPCLTKLRRDGNRPNGTYKSVPVTTVTDAIQSQNMVSAVGDSKNCEDSSPGHHSDHSNNKVNDNNNINNDNDDAIDGPGIDDQELEAVGTPQDSEVCLDTGDDVPAIRKSGATAV